MTNISFVSGDLLHLVPSYDAVAPSVLSEIMEYAFASEWSEERQKQVEYLNGLPSNWRLQRQHNTLIIKA